MKRTILTSAIPYHSILGHHGLDLQWSMLRPVRMAQCTRSAKREGRVGSVSGCGCFAATDAFAGSMCVCVVCAREKEGRWKCLFLLFYELGLYVGFLWGCALPASSVIPMLGCTRGLGTLKPGSSGLSQRTQACACPRYKSVNMHLGDVHVLTVQRGLDLNFRTPGSDGHAQCSTMVCTDFCLVSHIVKSYGGGDDDGGIDDDDDGDDDATL